MKSSRTQAAAAPAPPKTHTEAPGRLVVSGSLKAEEWDRAVQTANGGLLQSWDWGEFKAASGWSLIRLTLHRTVSNSGAHRPDQPPQICAQVLFRSVPRLPLPLSVAYIPRGPLYLTKEAGRTERPFWESVHKAARRRGAIFLKVELDVALDERVTKARIDRSMEALGFGPSGRLQPARTIVLDLAQTEDELLAAMKPKTRYNLRLAGRRGVAVRRAQSPEDLRAFYRLLQVTAQRDEFGIHTFPYYEEMWRRFGPQGRDTALVLLAEHPEEAERANGPIAGLLALRFGREAIYMYGASDNRGREHMPNYLLQWEAIRWAKAHGCEVYDFWGIPDAPAEDAALEEASPQNTRSGLRGVYWFKKGFGGREVEYPGAYDYVYNPLLYRLWMRWRGSDLG